MTTLAPTVIAALTIRAVKDFVQESIKAAMDSEKSFARVAASVEAIGVKWSDVSDEVVAATAKIQQNSRFDDDTAARSFQILLDKTQDYGKSLKNLGFVADYAAARISAWRRRPRSWARRWPAIPPRSRRRTHSTRATPRSSTSCATSTRGSRPRI